MRRAFFNGALLAESDRGVMHQGHAYFPLDSVRREYLKPAPYHLKCHELGSAPCFDIEVDGRRNRTGAWLCQNPTPKAAHLRNHVAFWKGVLITG